MRRIEDRKDGKEDPEAIHDLYKSLALGPTIVQGYFDADSKRLGHSYLIGDPTAQFQLRDVLFSLRTLVSDLQSALLDSKELDYKELQHASDTCRVNAGVCLGQLSQRLTEMSDLSRMHHQSPPAYVSGVPPMGSPSLHYSSSQSTHSSGRAMIPRTPEPFFAHQTLNTQWQPKRSDPNDQYHGHHRRRSTEASLQDSYSNWSETSQLYTEREADELSMRRPSSHTLAPEDGALLSPGFPSANQPPLLPGQLDIVRDSYTSFNAPSGRQTPARDSSASSQQERMQTWERFGAGEFPRVEQEVLGPLYPEQSDGRQSTSSYAQRAYDGDHHGGLEAVPPDVRFAATPQPLRLPHRPARTNSQESQGAPLRKPVAQHPEYPPNAFPNQYNPPSQAPYPVEQQQYPMYPPNQVDIQRMPVPPRSQSRASPSAYPHRVLSPSPPGPPYQPSPSVQRAMAKNLTRQFSIDCSVQSTSPSSPQPESNTYPVALSKTSSNAGSVHSSQPAFPVAQQAQFMQSPIQMPMAHTVQNQMQQPQHMRPPPPPPPPQQPLQQPQQPQQPVQLPPQLTPQLQQQQQQNKLTQSLHRAPSVMSMPIPPNLPLNLPTDKNTHPFCKGAFRLLIGLTKKAFISANRPVGISSFVSYWRCDKCLFEGPMHSVAGPLDKKGRPGKPEKIFDPTARECGPLSTAVVNQDGRGEGAGGIRYKWAFLAKCHVTLKTMPEGKPDGTFGSYGCIFCAAEGQARGWTGPNGTLTTSHGLGASDAASTFSGKSGHTTGSANGTQSGATPIFGNIRMFMDHLQMHRREEAWPCAEMQGRMKCIVGRLAERGEDWEVNFLPL